MTKTYADIGLSTYGDRLTNAKALQTSVAGLIATPSKEAHGTARSAWLDPRLPYHQNEAFRFGNPLVDDREGQANSWPLDEGLIDYVAEGYGRNEENTLSTLKVIATPHQAVADGADHIVVGRPIWQAKDPAAAARAVIAELP